jgi:uncharacterized protein YggE
MKKITLTLAALALTFAALQEAGAQNVMENVKPYIEVSGTAEREVIPDEIYLSITIRERYKPREKEKTTLAEMESQMKEAIKKAGMSLSDLTLSDANADLIVIKRKKEDVLTQKEYILKTHDAEEVGKVLDALEKIDIQDAYISRTAISGIDGIRKELRMQAMKSAKDKATYMLSAIEENLGKAIWVSENPSEYPMPVYFNRRSMPAAMMDAAAVPEATEPVEFRKTKIQVTVNVRFEIK